MLGVTVLYGIGGATAYADLTVGLAGAPAVAVAFGLLGAFGRLLFEAGPRTSGAWFWGLA